MVSDREHLPPLGEIDHICIRFNLRCNQQTVSQEQERLNVFKTDYGVVTEELSKWNWVELLNSSFEEDYATFVEKLESSLVNNTPMRTPRKEKKNLYMNREALREKAKKNRLWRKSLSTKSVFDRNNYIRCKNNF